MMRVPSSRGLSFLIVTMVYILAIAVGVITYRMCVAQCGEILAFFWADVVATVFTWLVGLVYHNVSVYDPYWSVAPPVILSINTMMHGLTPARAIVLVTVWIWAIRLTANWAVTFKGLQHEDWRYTKYRTEKPAWMFHLINFFGLNMMPTIVVFLSMLPAFRINAENACGSMVWTWLGAWMCLTAVAIQLVADTSAHRFRREHPGEICKVGLWKHGRHPNYFGEILMWWGVWVQAINQGGVDLYIVGPVMMTCMFLFISVPLMEGRQMKNKPGYAEYKKETRVLI